MSNLVDNFLNSLAFEDEIRSIKTAKSRPYYELGIPKKDLESHVDEGWSIHKELKTKYKVVKDKPLDEYFEDEVWVLLQSLGFPVLNKDRNLKIPYDSKGDLTQQIDVLAKDDESIMIVECKASNGEPKKSNFKKEIESLGGQKEHINAFLRKAFPGKKLKIAYIFATKNYFLSSVDSERLEHFGINHFDEEKIKYYGELAKQLGVSSRYQLEANLFHGTTIHEIDNEVAAIQGKMGGHTYYAFSIEPEKLLKLGYVLHRNQANVKLMPTYQRIMKRSRLKQINSFIEDGGFFPNSIVCSIDAKPSKNTFSPSSLQVEGSVTRLGVLSLPKKYRSIYIIDGQHRLYGYTGSKYAKSNSIPVVAFVNLSRSEQVKLFMEINENQKAVPRNLKITLESDLYWDSEDIADRINALKSQIAITLGEDLASPLYERVIIGEDQKSDFTTISLKSIKDGLSQTSFFGTYKGDEVLQDGTMYKGSNDATYNFIMPFLFGCFSYIRLISKGEWNLKQSEGGLLTAPIGANSLIRLFGDILDHLIASEGIVPKSTKPELLVEKMQYYLDPLAAFFDSIDDSVRKEIRTAYGSGGPTRLLRLMQKAINNDRPKYSPDGLEEYWEDESKLFNTQSFEMIRDIELFLNRDFKSKLSEKYGRSWIKQIPSQVYEEINALASKKNYALEESEEEVEPWDCLNLIHYRKIALFGSNWQEIFSTPFTHPDYAKGNKEEKTKWLDRLNRLRNKNFHTYSVKKDEFEFIKEIHSWLIT